MSDPYGGKYVTAGDKYVAADGSSMYSAPGVPLTQYVDAFGEDAPVVWAEQANQSFLSTGQAIMTPQGVISTANARFAVNKAGYNGPADAPSIATAYGLLSTPAPATPPSPAGHAAASAAIGGSLGLGSLSSVPRPVIYAGLALVAYEMFFKRGHR